MYNIIIIIIPGRDPETKDEESFYLLLPAHVGEGRKV